MDNRQVDLFKKISDGHQSGDQAALRKLRANISPADREAMLSAALGALTDRAIDEFQEGKR